MSRLNSKCLTPTVMTGFVNDIDPPATWFRRGTVSSERQLPNGLLEFGRITRTRQIAPYVKPNSSALWIDKQHEASQSLEIPSIRIKCSINPGDLFYGRQTFDFDCNIDQNANLRGRLQEAVNRVLARQSDDIDNTEEWVTAMGVTRGLVEYGFYGEDAFYADFGKPADHEVMLAGQSLWDNPLSFPPADIKACRKKIADVGKVQPTDFVMSPELSDAFTQHPAVQALLDNPGITFGNLDLTGDFTDDASLLFLGRIQGIRFWEYCRDLDVRGVNTPLIRPGWGELMALGAGNEVEFVYGAITDLDAVRGRGHSSSAENFFGDMISRRFAKSHQTWDPTSLQILTESRPMVNVRRPGIVCSIRGVIV